MSYLYKIERPVRHRQDGDRRAGRSKQRTPGRAALWLLGLPLPLILLIYLLMR